ncbi:MAG: tyrosine-type recombinase/integrase [Thalassobaculum sp.]|uniref:tyrosine-type recombinase/integrase n=1 Tax=Thalassobaculum sp. TaxID=2022740 RepID=UPI0032EAA4DD
MRMPTHGSNKPYETPSYAKGSVTSERSNPGELRKLLASKSKDRVLIDLIWLSLFTGARVNEICSLTVDDVVDGGLRIREGKSDAAARWLPIPEDVREVVERRATGEGWLIPGLKPGGPDKKRSWNVQKRVNRWIDKVLGDPENATFHSLRPSYSTACEQVGLHQYTHCELMGHKKPNLATQVYSEGKSVAQLRKAQEEVSRHIREEWLRPPTSD